MSKRPYKKEGIDSENKRHKSSPNDNKESLQAAETGDINRIKALLDQGENINTVDNDGKTLLLRAICEDKPQVVRYLVGLGADVNICDRDSGISPLSMAIIGEDLSGKDLSIVEELSNAKAELFPQDNNGNTALHTAASRGNLKAVQLILNRPEATKILDLKNEWQWSPLDCAAIRKHTEIMQVLLENEAKIDPKALNLAANMGNEEAINLLIKYGADVKAVDEIGRNSLHYAYLGIVHNNLDNSIIRFLKDLGVPDIQDNEGDFPMDLLGDY